MAISAMPHGPRKGVVPRLGRKREAGERQRGAIAAGRCARGPSQASAKATPGTLSEASRARRPRITSEDSPAAAQSLLLNPASASHATEDVGDGLQGQRLRCQPHVDTRVPCQAATSTLLAFGRGFK